MITKYCITKIHTWAEVSKNYAAEAASTTLPTWFMHHKSGNRDDDGTETRFDTMDEAMAAFEAMPSSEKIEEQPRERYDLLVSVGARLWKIEDPEDGEEIIVDECAPGCFVIADK